MTCSRCHFLWESARIDLLVPDASSSQAVVASDSDMETEESPPLQRGDQLAVVPVSSANNSTTLPSLQSPVYRSTLKIQVNNEENKNNSNSMPGPSSGAIPKQLQPPPSSSQPVQRPSAPPHIRKLPPVINQLASGPRLQAFAVSSSPASGFNQIPQQLPAANKTTKQLETRQRQLEMLRRMEERYKNMAPVQRPPAAAGQPSPPQPIPQRPPDDPHLPPQGDHNQQVWPLIPFFLFAFTVVENSQKS